MSRKSLESTHPDRPNSGGAPATPDATVYRGVNLTRIYVTPGRPPIERRIPAGSELRACRMSFDEIELWYVNVYSESGGAPPERILRVGADVGPALRPDEAVVWLLPSTPAQRTPWVVYASEREVPSGPSGE